MREKWVDINSADTLVIVTQLVKQAANNIVFIL